jgi:hypothetical protein
VTTLRRGIWALPFVALILVLMGLRIPLIETRGFNPDELEHMHFTWRISRGEVPYRDYFEHHTPALHYALQPIFAGLDVARSSHDAVRVLFRGRSVMWASAFLSHRGKLAGL